jgi:hypothetical protein
MSKRLRHYASGPSFEAECAVYQFRRNTGLDLTNVDPPSINQAPNDEQDDNDVETVHALVDLYIANPER